MTGCSKGNANAVTIDAPPVKRPRRAEKRAETMELILGTAEELFSKHGLHGVTLKEVAKRVGVHHTLLNYYFADKTALFDAVFARGAVVTSKRRMKALGEYEAACGATRPSKVHCTYSSTPTSIYLSTAAKAGEITPNSARRSPIHPNGVPNLWTRTSIRWCSD